MSIYVFHVNKLAFIVSTSCRIQFVTVEYVNDISKLILMVLIKKVFNFYYKRTFKVTFLLMDQDLDTMQDDIYGLNRPTVNKILAG